MGAESAPQSPLGRVDVAALAPKPDVVVEPRNVNLAAEAFRSGLLTPQDFQLGMLRNQAAQNQLDPALVEARKQQEISQASTAQTQAEAGQLALTQAKRQADLPAMFNDMQKELAQHNWQVAVPANVAPDPESVKEVVRRWSALETWKTNVGKASAEHALVNNVDVTTDEGTKKIAVAGKSLQPVPLKQVADLEKYLAQYPTPQLFDAAGQPAAPSIFTALAPGTSATSPGGTTAAGSDGLVVKSGVGDKKAATENQVKAAMAGARFITADEIFKNLEAAGYNPGSAKNWAQELLVGPLKAFASSDKRQFDAAKDDWLQGLLRLESGAAISVKEQSWYGNTFFPTGLEPEVVQKQKAKMRSDVEKIANEVARSGHLDVNALLKVNSQAEAIAATPARASQKRITVPGKGTGYVDYSNPAQPRFVLEIPEGASGAPAAYTPPLTLGSPSGKSLVEPKAGPKVYQKDW